MKFILIVGLLLVGGFFLFRHFFAVNTTSSFKEVVYGPFTIKMERFSSWSFNMNVGRKVKNVSISYTVSHKGQPVGFSEKLQTNTGFSHLWRVYILKDAPFPTLIAGSQSLYLIAEENGTLKVTPIEEQSTDFANLQWLDAAAGQPTPSQEVFMANESDGDGKVDTLQGGEYLMVNRHQVLHVPTLKQYPINVNNEAIDNYSYLKDALAFSSNREIIVFPADFQTWNSPENPKYKKALIAYHFKEDRGYAIPFGKSETRLYADTEINREWLLTYFEWEGTGDKMILKLKKMDQLPYWTGRYDGYAYKMYPVKAALQPVLLDLVLEKMGWTKADIIETTEHEYTGKIIRFGKGELRLQITYKEQELSLSKDLYEGDEDKCKDKVQEISKFFDQKLLKGEYQAYFTEIPEKESWE